MKDTKAKLLNSLVQSLSSIENVAGIVLGGSHCTGWATDDSDLDIGVYYLREDPFHVEDISRIARQYDVRSTVTGFYEWGPWVNGGAWITAAEGQADILYRDINQVKDMINRAKQGHWENNYEQQPPFGFSSVIYLAETFYCQPLYDPHGHISSLKNELFEYPPLLRKTIVQHALWTAQFSLWQAHGFAGKNDMYNTSGCVTRAVKFIVESLLALNGIYPMGDKHALRQLGEAKLVPPSLQQTIDGILSFRKDDLKAQVSDLQLLFDATAGYAGNMYKPYFDL